MSYLRFDVSTVGSHYNPAYLLSLSDKELGYWNHDLCRDLCYRASMLDEFMATEEGNEELLLKAAEKLGVEIF